MDCKFCGAALNNGETSCPYCGNKNVRQNAPPPEPPSVPAPADDELNPENHRSVNFDDGMTLQQREKKAENEKKTQKIVFACCALPTLIFIIALVVIILFN